MRANAHGATRLNRETRKDLELWQAFLDKTHQGVDKNLIMSRVTDYIIRTDACEHGLGGFSLTTGRAWRHELPKDARNLKSINFLEFLACITGIIISLYEGSGAAGDCFLSLGDNTSSLGSWLRKSNFAADGDQGSHSAVARAFALLVAKYGVDHFSQWFPGKENEVAHIVSCDQSRSNDRPIYHIKFIYATQVSETLQIIPMPPELTPWLYYWVRHTPASKQSPPTPGRKRAGTSTTGSAISNNVSSTVTRSSTNSFTADRHKLLGADMQAVREQTYAKSTLGYDHLVASSCHTALDGVREDFRTNGQPDPSLDPNPSTRQQKPIPLTLMKQMITKQCSDPGLIAPHELVNFAYFFAMRSCEYLETSGGKTDRSNPPPKHGVPQK